MSDKKITETTKEREENTLSRMLFELEQRFCRYHEGQSASNGENKKVEYRAFVQCIAIFMEESETLDETKLPDLLNNQTIKSLKSRV